MDEEKATAMIWQEWATNVAEFDEQLEIERGGPPQERDGMDEVFPVSDGRSRRASRSRGPTKMGRL